MKVEGNPFSPISHGRLCARGQASLNGLYDPDRIPGPLVRKGEGWDRTTWQDAEARLLTGLQQHRGRTVFLTHNFTGTLDRLLDDWSAAFQIERMRYDTFGWEPVRAAHQMLTAMGMDGFAERARRELLATGETVRKRTVDTLTDLTAREAQIAKLARDGHTNQEIAVQLFISPHTVEWHLGNVFTKLGIASRKDLR